MNDDDDDYVEPPPAIFLRDLAERLRFIPCNYGTDDSDIDRLREIAKMVESTWIIPHP